MPNASTGLEGLSKRDGVVQMIDAKQVFNDFVKLGIDERARFFALLANSVEPDHLSHDELFGDLKEAEFTAQEAAQYLELRMATFRRYLKSAKIRASSSVGNVHLYALDDLKAFKQARGTVKARPH